MVKTVPLWVVLVCFWAGLLIPVVVDRMVHS